MQATRRAVAKTKGDIKRDRWVFAAPLVLLIAVLCGLLALFSWQAASGHAVHAPLLLMWTILGLAGFFMPILTLVQKIKLDLIAKLRAAAAVLEGWKKESIAAALKGLLLALQAELAASTAMQERRRAEVVDSCGAPHLCLTPRILAQRPQAARVPRG